MILQHLSEDLRVDGSNLIGINFLDISKYRI